MKQFISLILFLTLNVASFAQVDASLPIKENDKGMYQIGTIGNFIPVHFPEYAWLTLGEIPILCNSVDYTIGYSFSQKFGLGLGVGNMFLTREVFTETHVNLRGYFFKKNFSLFYDMNVGVGFSVDPNTEKNSLNYRDDVEFSGFARPSIGIRFPSKNKMHATLDIGCLMKVGSRVFNNGIGPSIRAGFTF
ncbi:hypothetical protein [Aureispira anguillae]|uniref:Outer membrane protein beta-barrel domain-containing protein n=1 Tax=Aureispira anguillae TaxID=2864201 RepID=A0A915YK87_9BACT|nr:hypothetical protein [Aureispira anguillae]BDS14497.1 hypothetical protein AsAng_0052770 [Aureispira anguillae]